MIGGRKAAFKVVVFGASKSGKTAFLRRGQENVFDGKYSPDNATQAYPIEVKSEETSITLQYLECPFDPLDKTKEALIENDLQGAHALVFTFRVRPPESFKWLSNELYARIRRVAKEKPHPIMYLVATCADSLITDFEKSCYEDMMRKHLEVLKAEYGIEMSYHLTCAKDNTGIQELLTKQAQDLAEKHKNQFQQVQEPKPNQQAQELINEDAEHYIDIEKRKKTENKLEALKEQFKKMQNTMLENGMLSFFVRLGIMLVEKADNAYSEAPLKNKAYQAYHQFLDSLKVAADEFDSLHEKTKITIQIKRQLESPRLTDSAKQNLQSELAEKQADLTEEYGKLIATTGNLVVSSLALPGKTSLRKVLLGLGVAVAGSLIIGASILLFLSTASTSLPLSGLVAMIGADLILSGVGIAIGVTLNAVSVAALVGGCIFATKGLQYGFSKDVYESSRSIQRGAEFLVTNSAT